MKTLIALIVAALVTAVRADDIKTIDGTEYKNVTINRTESDGIVITHSTGVAKIPFSQLPNDAQKQFADAKVEQLQLPAAETEERQSKAAVQQATKVEEQARAAVAQAEAKENIAWRTYQQTVSSNDSRHAAEAAKEAVVAARQAAN